MRSFLSLALARCLAACFAVCFAACGGAPDAARPSTIAPADDDAPAPTARAGVEEEGEVPTGPLPRNVVPTGYTLALTVDPRRDAFTGIAQIAVTVERPTRHIYLHGNRIRVSEVSVTRRGARATTLAGEWEQVDDEGVAIIRLDDVLRPGEAVIEVVYATRFASGLRGLYRVEEGGESYAFTQFEALSARLAFPSFDEPAFKVPFDMTLTVPKEHEAAFNTPVANVTELPGDVKQVRFETTKPMPTYLVAMAVGPFDVVEHEAIAPTDVRSEPVPLRGLAVRGKGEQLAYALENTGRILVDLEAYFGMPYPYRKLDIVAVPDFGAGAMENVGLVTFREPLLLLGDGESAPENQKRGYAYVMAHELAHMWFGNLVTMPWWDDIWLNEAFATWMGNRSVDRIFPEYQADVSFLSSVQRAMQTDGLVSARQIRQPIETPDDIRNAFDSITYRKGGGVLAMFEEWIGQETFQAGIRAYMREHSYATATYEDLLEALGAAAEKDVATPFRTFLFQAGLPFLNVSSACSEGTATVTVRQSRYFPTGSTGDANQTWQIPMCLRYGGEGEPATQCELLTEPEATITLPSCPAWVMPNAEGAGYFRFALDASSLEALTTRGWSKLSAREKLALADSLRAAFGNASLDAEAVMPSLMPFARSDIRQVATMPMGLLELAEERLTENRARRNVRDFAQDLYFPRYYQLRMEPRRGEEGETALLRAAVVQHLALFVEQENVRGLANRKGLAFLGYPRRGAVDRGAVDPNLVDTVLTVAVQEGDRALFDYVLARFLESDDALLRGQLLRALSSTKNDVLAGKARELALDSRLRGNEVPTPLFTQMRMEETRDATWRYVRENITRLMERLDDRAGFLPWLAASFCSEEKAVEAERFFTPFLDQMPGGPRNLASATEAIRLCAAGVEAQGASAQRFFSRQ
ncbi:MAG: M1 family metallopeptidase [Myxococcota bacterium]